MWFENRHSRVDTWHRTCQLIEHWFISLRGGKWIDHSHLQVSIWCDVSLCWRTVRLRRSETQEGLSSSVSGKCNSSNLQSKHFSLSSFVSFSIYLFFIPQTFFERILFSFCLFIHFLGLSGLVWLVYLSVIFFQYPVSKLRHNCRCTKVF